MENVISSPKLHLPERSLSERLWLVGTLLGVVIGVALAGWGVQKLQSALVFEISVLDTDTYKRIINSGLSNDRLIAAIVGATTTVCGSIVAAGSAILFGIDRLCRR